MNDTQHLADLRERFGPDATRVGDPPTAGDVALLLRLLDELREACNWRERSAIMEWHSLADDESMGGFYIYCAVGGRCDYGRTVDEPVDGLLDAYHKTKALTL